eukprot:426143_1
MTTIRNNKKTVSALVIIGIFAVIFVAFIIFQSQFDATSQPTTTMTPSLINSTINPPTINQTIFISTSYKPTRATTALKLSEYVVPIIITPFTLSLIISAIACVVRNKKKIKQMIQFGPKQTDEDSEYIGPIDKPDSLYWIFNDILSGPYDKEKICDMYLHRELFGTIKVQNAKLAGSNDHRDWFSIYLSPLYTEDLRNILGKNIGDVDEQKKHDAHVRERFVKYFPNLYDALRKVKSGYQSSMIRVPQLPSKNMYESYGISAKILLVLGLLIIMVLSICIVMMSFLWIILYELFHLARATRKKCYFYHTIIPNDFDSMERGQPVEISDYDRKIACISVGIQFIIKLFSTYLIVYVVYILGEYVEIQSWMVGFFAWSFFFQLVTSLNSYGRIMDNTKMVHVMSKLSLFINGIGISYNAGTINFPFFDLLTALLPASIVGFTVNYILQERFLLKCKEDYTESDICFQEDVGCCHVISSHNFENAYYFIGGSVSNILASFTAIRLCAWIMIHAVPKLKAVSSRKK